MKCSREGGIHGTLLRGLFTWQLKVGLLGGELQPRTEGGVGQMAIDIVSRVKGA